MIKLDFKKLILLGLLLFLLLPLNFCSGETQHYDYNYEENLYRSDEHNYSIVFPEDWKIKEGRNPNVVIKAVSENGEGLEMINIGVRDIPNKLQEQDITEIKNPGTLLEGYKNASVLDSGTTHVNNKQALWIKSIWSYSNMDITVYSKMYQVIVLHDNKLFFITAGAGGGTREKAESNYRAHEKLFKQSVGSFQFEDWDSINSSQTSINTEDKNFNGGNYAFSPLALIISFLLTWGIGLSIPLLIRFVFLKRPLSKGKAVAIVGALYFFNLILFIALGSKSKTHAALFLVAAVSYWILRKDSE